MKVAAAAMGPVAVAAAEATVVWGCVAAVMAVAMAIVAAAMAAVMTAAVNVAVMAAAVNVAVMAAAGVARARVEEARAMEEDEEVLRAREEERVEEAKEEEATVKDSWATETVGVAGEREAMSRQVNGRCSMEEREGGAARRADDCRWSPRSQHVSQRASSRSRCWRDLTPIQRHSCAAKLQRAPTMLSGRLQM